MRKTEIIEALKSGKLKHSDKDGYYVEVSTDVRRSGKYKITNKQYNNLHPVYDNDGKAMAAIRQ